MCCNLLEDPLRWLGPRIHVFAAAQLVLMRTWTPTDQVRGLKAHGTSPAEGTVGCWQYLYCSPYPGNRTALDLIRPSMGPAIDVGVVGGVDHRNTLGLDSDGPSLA